MSGSGPSGPAPGVPSGVATTPGVPAPVAQAVVRPIGPSLVRTGLAIACAFAVLAGGAGWWQVIRAPELATAPDNPVVIAAARRVLRGPIVDRNGQWLARSSRDKNGEARRTYRDDTVSQVVGYASTAYGSAGLERQYAAALLGLTGTDPFGGLVSKLDPTPRDGLGLQLSLDLRLQQAAVAGLGDDRGAVVMLDPTTGEILALASTPTYDASAIADPATAKATMTALQDDTSSPLLPRATLGTYVPGSVFKIVTAIAALDSGAVTPSATFPQQPAAETAGLLVDGFRITDGHHPFTDGTVLDFANATEVSCNIWYALAGLATGGPTLISEAAKLGFGQPIPFDLPTATSQLTNGTGSAPGGFAGSTEVASAAFGQGQVLVTPLQMALVAAAVANGGELMRPHIVTAITGSGPGATTIGDQAWQRVTSVENANAIRDAMVQAVEGRFGKLFTTGAAVPGIVTAGKSGTAQLGGSGEPNSWFIGFAPADHPTIAIAVIVEHGGRGGARAAPLAGTLMADYFRWYPAK